MAPIQNFWGINCIIDCVAQLRTLTGSRTRVLKSPDANCRHFALGEDVLTASFSTGVRYFCNNTTADRAGTVSAPVDGFASGDSGVTAT